nr:ABC transporter ATP-binding protein [Patulibacter sp. SYSU D01012]
MRAEGLVRRYGDRTVLRGVDVHAEPGEIVAILGPNGAGKTTLLSLLAGLQPPDAGTVGRTAREVGWIPQQPALYRRLTVRENLELFARLDDVPDAAARVDRMLDQAGLADRAQDPVGSLSGGGQQRVNVAIGLLGDPPVVLLDEPSSSLDPRQRERMWRFLTDLAAEGRAVVFSTHDVAEAERYAARVVVLVAGRIAFAGTPGALAAQAGGDLLRAFVDLVERDAPDGETVPVGAPSGRSARPAQEESAGPVADSAGQPPRAAPAEAAGEPRLTDPQEGAEASPPTAPAPEDRA